jgi:hypothetical protein
MAAVYPHLEPGEVTVGTLINMTHLSASPPGTLLVAEARAVAVEGRSVRFAVVVADAPDQIAASGEHGLRVVDGALPCSPSRQAGTAPSPWSVSASLGHQRPVQQPSHLPAVARSLRR